MDDFLVSLGAPLVAGLLAGLTVAMPFGPFGQLAARLTTEKKRRAARELAFTAVGIDAVLAALVLLFMHVLPADLTFSHPLVQGGLGLILLLLGLEVLRTTPACVPGQLPGGFTQPWQFAAVYGVLHPGSFLIFMGTFGVLHSQGVLTASATPLLAKGVCWLGVVVGMVLMWVIWLSIVHHLKRRVERRLLRGVFSYGVAAGLLLAGALLLWHSGLWSWLKGVW